MRICTSLILRDSQGRLLLQMRDNNPGIDAPLLWNFFGGGMEEGEDPLVCSQREMEEELGLQVPLEKFTLLFTQEMADIDHREHAVSVDHVLVWKEFDVLEGAGAGFFSLDDALQIPMADISKRVLEEMKARGL